MSACILVHLVCLYVSIYLLMYLLSNLPITLFPVCVSCCMLVLCVVASVCLCVYLLPLFCKNLVVQQATKDLVTPLGGSACLLANSGLSFLVHTPSPAPVVKAA